MDPAPSRNDRKGEIAWQGQDRNGWLAYGIQHSEIREFSKELRDGLLPENVHDARHDHVGLANHIYSGREVNGSSLYGFLGIAEPPLPPTVNYTFELRGYPRARTVTVAGTFNDWSRDRHSCTQDENGWICHIDLVPNTYEYKFLVDNHHWTTDPVNQHTRHDRDGNVNSLLVVERVQRSPMEA